MIELRSKTGDIELATLCVGNEPKSPNDIFVLSLKIDGTESSTGEEPKPSNSMFELLSKTDDTELVALSVDAEPKSRNAKVPELPLPKIDDTELVPLSIGVSEEP